MTLEQQARQLSQLRERMNKAQRAADEARAAYDAAHRALWDRMDGDDVDMIRVGSVTFSKKTPMPYAVVQDKYQLYEWAVEQGNAPELFEPGPRAKLLNERVRLAIDNGEELPPGLGFYTKQTVSQRR